MEEDAIDKAEDDSGGTYTEGECKDGDEGKTTVSAEVAERITEVGCQTVEIRFHTSEEYNEKPANYRDQRYLRRLPSSPNKRRYRKSEIRPKAHIR
jgi:hypothetical protein